MNNNNQKVKRNSAKKVFSGIGTVLVTLYVILVLFFSISVFTSMGTGHPSILGNTLLYVRTDSMESDAPDAIFKGDLVICSEENSYVPVEIGDIIAYRATVYQKNDAGETEEHEIVRIHRVIEDRESECCFITVGDNSPDNDGDGKPDPDEQAVYYSSVLGVYNGKRIPKVGSFFEFVQSQNGILFCLVIPMAAFFIYALFKFVKAMIEFKLEKATSGAPTNGELTEEQKQAAIAEYLAKQAAEANKDENNTDN